MAKGVDHTEGNLGLCGPHSHSIPSKVNWSRYKDLTIYIKGTMVYSFKLEMNSLKEIDMNFLLIFVRQMGG